MSEEVDIGKVLDDIDRLVQMKNKELGIARTKVAEAKNKMLKVQHEIAVLKDSRQGIVQRGSRRE